MRLSTTCISLMMVSSTICPDPDYLEIGHPDLSSEIASLYCSSPVPYEELFRSLPSATIVVNPELIITDATNLYFDLTGLTRDVVGRPIVDVANELRSEDTGPYNLVRTLRSVVLNKKKESYDFIDKYDRNWHTDVYPVFVPAGSETMVLMQCQVTDTTLQRIEQQRHANILEQLHDVNNYRRLVNAVRHYAIFIVDVHRKVTHWNQGGVTLTGWSERDAVGRSIFDFYEESAHGAISDRLNTIQNEINHGLDTKFKRKDKTTFVADTTITRITRHRQETNTIGFAFAVRDMTQTIADQNALREAYEQAAIMKDEFTSRCSHDIRTPLNSISLATDALFATTLTSEQNDLVFLIKRSIKRQLVHVNEILDFGKLTTPNRRPSLHLEPTDLSTYLAVEFDDYKLIAPDDIAMHLEMPSTFPTYLVDQTKFQQVVQNIISNSIKYTTKGSVELRVREIGKVDEMTDEISFQFRDTGKGVKSTDIPILFTPYTQIDGSNTQQNRGSGLGLTIVKIVTESMGGKVTMTSEGLGKGTLVEVVLPLRRCKMARPQLKRTPTSIVRAVGDGTQPILVAEDNKTNRDLLVRGLLRIGYTRVDQAVDGKQMLDMIPPGHPYKLIISDVQMPVMSGIEATIRLRQYDKVTPVIALTADGMQQNIDRCRASGMLFQLIKPTRIKNLGALIYTILNNDEVN